MAISVGDRVLLKSSPARYFGGVAIVLEIDLTRRLSILVRREGDIGQGRREIWVYETAISSPPPDTQGAKEV